jgi:hypothetical protein
LFFGLLPFPGFDHLIAQLLTTPRGWALILTGSAVGGLFAAFAMAISLFSIPMLLSQRTDALTALGTSFALTAQNLRVVLPWGFIVAIGFVVSVLTGLLGLIVISRCSDTAPGMRFRRCAWTPMPQGRRTDHERRAVSDPGLAGAGAGRAGGIFLEHAPQPV